MTTEAQRLKDRVKELGDLIDGLSDERSKAKQQIADLECPFKVGDRVAYRSQSYVISAIRYSSYGAHDLYAKKFKKNGDLGSLEHRLYAWGNEKAVKL